MEIPCHANSWSQIDLVAVWSESTPNSMTIPCHLSKFHLFSMLQHDMDFGQVQVMEFRWYLLRKWWDFHWIWSHFRPNCRKKDLRKSVSHFLQGQYERNGIYNKSGNKWGLGNEINTNTRFVPCFNYLFVYLFPPSMESHFVSPFNLSMNFESER